MAIELVTKFQPYVDEMFTTESKKSLLTNQDFDWTGAHTVKIYKISTGSMNDYGRTGPSGDNWSRYGKVESLNATTEEFTLSKDRSFTFAIDALDKDETAQQLQPWPGSSGKSLFRKLILMCTGRCAPAQGASLQLLP